MEEKEPHFNHIFWFITSLSAAIMLYIFAATFLEIPEKSVRFVDSNMGYLQNILVAVVSYFVGASVQKSKSDKNQTT